MFAGQHHIIMMLERVGCATVSQIAEEMRTTSATASVSIKRLEKAGFVEKRSSDSDARITKIYLTDKALAVTQRIRSKMSKRSYIDAASINIDVSFEGHSYKARVTFKRNDSNTVYGISIESDGVEVIVE